MSQRLPISAELQREVKEEAGHCCAICKYRLIEIHHIVPYSKVKKHEFKNLIALCPNCHRSYHYGIISVRSMFNYKRKLKKNITQQSNSYKPHTPRILNKPKRLGIVVASLSKEKEIASKHTYNQKQGILIKTVLPKTIGSLLEIPQESLLLKINGEKIDTLSKYKAAITLARKGNRRLQFLIKYQGQNRYFIFDV